MKNKPIQSKTLLEIPEGTFLPFKLANPMLRGYALLIDLLFIIILFGVMNLVIAVIASDHRISSGLMLIGAFVLFWGYFIFFESRSNTSPGKRILSLSIINESGIPPTFGQIVLRNLLKFTVDAFPGFFGIGLFSILLHPKNMRLGDIVAGTIVIHHVPTPTFKHEPSNDVFTPSVTLNSEEQHALLLFSHYASHPLRQSRAEELANILAPVLIPQYQKMPPHLWVNYLKAYANWYVGNTK